MWDAVLKLLFGVNAANSSAADRAKRSIIAAVSVTSVDSGGGARIACCCSPIQVYRWDNVRNEQVWLTTYAVYVTDNQYTPIDYMAYVYSINNCPRGGLQCPGNVLPLKVIGCVFFIVLSSKLIVLSFSMVYCNLQYSVCFDVHIDFMPTQCSQSEKINISVAACLCPEEIGLCNVRGVTHMSKH